MRWLSGIALVCACGSPNPPAGPGSRPPPIDAPLPPLPPECAATYAEVPSGQTCTPTPGRALRCEYPQGVCECLVQTPCTGMMLSDEDHAALPIQWQCTPTPPLVRADGCPGAEPWSGQVPCDQPGRVCSYQTCCSTDYTCRSGLWERSGGICPP